MKLWLVVRLDPADYDEPCGFVIRAKSDRAARAIAEEEFSRTWRGRSLSYSARWDVERLTANGGPAGVVLEDFLHG